jgi:hypothetical protein
MTPDPREIAAVLAAPEPVREALRRCGGPGWFALSEHQPQLHVEAWPHYAPVWAWLPVDPTAIVAEAARIAGVQAWWIDHLRDGSTLIRLAGPSDDMPGPDAVDGPTPRLAALALLSAVVGSRT